jgi:midasin
VQTSCIRTPRDVVSSCKMLREGEQWRQLELSSWPGLLNAELLVFQDNASGWWFRLYDAVFRSPVSKEEEEEEENNGASLSAYLDSLIPLLDDFIRSSPIGQFQSRLDLLHALCIFSGRVVVKRPIARRVHDILHSTLQFYGMFSKPIEESLKKEHLVLEKEIRDVIKLASWRDVNVFALKQSALKSHHSLYKLIRKFREVLRQPVTDRLRIPSSDNPSKFLSLIFPVWPTQQQNLVFVREPGAYLPMHFHDLSQTYSRFRGFLDNRIRPFIETRPVSMVEDMATTIIETSQHFASISIPANLPTEKRRKQVKALLVRKRKALSDLLKELKRVGLGSNVKPEVLAKLHSLRWIREQPPNPSNSEISKRGEDYYFKLCELMIQLRNSLTNHHSDIMTRELQRGLMFVESAFFLGVDSRGRYVLCSLCHV